MDDPTSVNEVQMYLERREGTLLYTDTSRPGVRALGVLTLVAYYEPDTGNLSLGYASNGYVPAALEALAGYFVKHPEMRAQFDGMYMAQVIKSQQQGKA